MGEDDKGGDDSDLDGICVASCYMSCKAQTDKFLCTGLSPTVF